MTINNRSITLREISTNISNQFLVVSIRYEKGGANYFTGTNTPRGYYLSVTPVKDEKHGEFTSRSFIAFTGIKECLKEASKYSEKELNSIAYLHSTQWNGTLEKLINHVCNKTGLKCQPILLND